MDIQLKARSRNKFGMTKSKDLTRPVMLNSLQHLYSVFRIFHTGPLDRGVTLIELLVALVISSILIAAFYRLFISQQQTYSVQEQVSDMQQNARAGINRMMSEIRMAGFGNVSMVLPVTLNSKTFNNVLNPDSPAAGAFTLISAVGDTTAVSKMPGEYLNPSDPTTKLEKNQIVVSRLNNDSGTTVVNTENKRYVSIGGVESHAVTAIDTESKKLTLDGNIIHHHLSGTPVFGIRAVTYQVVNEGEKLTLKRDENTGGGRQPLADNIESIQFEYLDASGNPTVIPASIRMVRITLRARTQMPDPKFKGGVAEAGDPNLQKGTYRIRQITSSVYLRNMRVSP
jgi:prepilin-type N-terminal cleavage/methylation domain-containing protein